MTGVRALFYYQLSFLRKALWGECELGPLYVTIIVTCILRRFFFQLKKTHRTTSAWPACLGNVLGGALIAVTHKVLSLAKVSLKTYHLFFNTQQIL